jgi:hypothetical protein
MSTEHKRHHLPKSILQPVAVGLLCLDGGIVVGDGGPDRPTNVLVRKRETINSIAKEFRRLVSA